MTNYNVTTKLIRANATGDVDALVTAYINSLADTKVIRAVTAVRIGSDGLLVMIVHDA